MRALPVVRAMLLPSFLLVGGGALMMPRAEAAEAQAACVAAGPTMVGLTLLALLLGLGLGATCVLAVLGSRHDARCERRRSVDDYDESVQGQTERPSGQLARRRRSEGRTRTVLVQGPVTYKWRWNAPRFEAHSLREWGAWAD